MKNKPGSFTRPDQTPTIESTSGGTVSTESSIETMPADEGAADGSREGLAALTSRLLKFAWGLGALAIVGSVVTIAVEQHRQTNEMRKSGCYARAAAAAAVAATEIARSGSSGANPGLTFLECDQVAGIAP
jgi:hypothetical protein